MSHSLGVLGSTGLSPPGMHVLKNVPRLSLPILYDHIKFLRDLLQFHRTHTPIGKFIIVSLSSDSMKISMSYLIFWHKSVNYCRLIGFQMHCTSGKSMKGGSSAICDYVTATAYALIILQILRSGASVVPHA